MKFKIVLETGMDGYIIAYCPALKGCVKGTVKEILDTFILKNKFQNIVMG